MAELRINCTHCGAELACPEETAGQEIACPNCGGVLRVGPPGASAPPPPPTPMIQPESSAPAPAPAAVPQDAFPERMKANRALMGRTCTSCGQAIDLGQEVFNCQTCQQTMHQACQEQAGGCMNPQCPQSVALRPVAPSGGAAPAAGAPAEDTAPCKFCQEPIKIGARRCRHCGELQNDTDREAEQKRKKQADSDESLATWEILVGVLCGGIGCIIGIVYAVQGKKKGGKLILLSILCNIAWRVLFTIIGAGMGP